MKIYRISISAQDGQFAVYSKGLTGRKIDGFAGRS